jgi:DNA (cytosine-5)-methyltransferase 1
MVRGRKKVRLAVRTAVADDGVDESAYVSLFSGGGIGDLGIAYGGVGARLVAACEIDPKRAALLRAVHPDTLVFARDVAECGADLVSAVRAATHDGATAPWLCLMSPPCQGMSSNGLGRIGDAIRAGKRSEHDARNALFVPGLAVALRLRPRWIVVENVQGMLRRRHSSSSSSSVSPTGGIHTVADGEARIADVIVAELEAQGYAVETAAVDFARWGVPQRRKRLLIVGRQRAGLDEDELRARGTFFPPCQHDAPMPEVTLRDAIADLPALDGRDRLCDDDDPWHCVPRLTEHAHFCVRHTPPEQSAMDNTVCVRCGHDACAPSGRASAARSSSSAVVCDECGAMLPRPAVMRSSEGPRLVRAFKTSYRRMSYDRVANTVTTNSGVASSDVKLHPTQTRVLSVREVMRLCTVSSLPSSSSSRAAVVPWHDRFPDRPSALPPKCTTRCVRSVLGECIPPAALARLAAHLRHWDRRRDVDDDFLRSKATH